MELMCDAKHTFLSKVETIENSKKILITPVININKRTSTLFQTEILQF